MMRRTLTLKSAASTEPTAETSPATAASAVIEAAIARRLCIRVVYNRTEMQLAPHILYTRHDDPFLDAVVTERAGKPPREIKLASFKLAGLSGIALTMERFEPQSVFDPAEPRYADCTIMMIRREQVTA